MWAEHAKIRNRTCLLWTGPCGLHTQRFFWEITSFFLAPDFCGSQQRPRKAANIQSVNLPCRPSGTIIKFAETSNLKAIIVIKVSKFEKQIFLVSFAFREGHFGKNLFYLKGIFQEKSKVHVFWEGHKIWRNHYYF